MDDLTEENPDALLLDGFEAAFIGVARRCGQPSLAVYDRDRCLRILMARDGLTEEEAEEYFSYNTRSVGWPYDAHRAG